MYNLKGIYIIWYREILIYLRNRIKFFSSIFLPLVLLIFFGTGLKNIFPMVTLPYNFADFFFPGILTIGVTTLALSSTMSVVWDREFGFLKEILVAPVSRISIALGKILGATTTALIEGFLLLLAAPYIGIHVSFSIFIFSLMILFLIAFGMAGLGLVFASRVKKTESFTVIIQLLIAPMIFLSGTFFPINNGPWWMIKLSRYNPLTYGVNALRWAMLKQTFSSNIISNITTTNFLSALEICILFDIIITMIAIILFHKIR